MYTPLKLVHKFSHTELVDNRVKNLVPKTLSQDINNLIPRLYIWDINETIT